MFFIGKKISPYINMFMDEAIICDVVESSILPLAFFILTCDAMTSWASVLWSIIFSSQAFCKFLKVKAG